MSNSRRKSEEGAALLMALLLLTTMGLLATGLIFTVQTEMKTSTAYKYSEQAYYVANGGVQRAVYWYNNGYTPHLPAGDYDITTLPVRFGGSNVLLAGQTGSSSVYPDSTTMSGFGTQFSNKTVQADSNNSGVYAVNASLLKYTSVTMLNTSTFGTYPSAIERWRVDSYGYWGTNTNPLGVVQVTASIENSGNALFDRALWGIDLVDLKGTVNVDSYDPTLGPYGGTNVGQLGSIGSNGTVSLNGTVSVAGDAAYGPSGAFQVTGVATVTGSIIHLPAPRVFPPLPAITVGTTNVSVNGNNSVTIGPGSYKDISAGAQSTLTLTPGTYYIDTLSEGAQATIRITGPTTIYVKSGLDITGQGILNTSTDPANLTILYGGTAEAKMAGGSGFYGSVYAPNATVKLTGSSSFFGSFIGKTVTDSGTPQIHFDQGSLKRNLIPRPFRVMTWSRNAY